MQVTTPKTRFKMTIPQPLAVEREYIVHEGQPEYLNLETNPGHITIQAAKETLHSTGHKGPPYKDGGPFKVRRYSVRRSAATINQHFIEGTPNPEYPLKPGYSRRTIDGVRWHTQDYSGVPLLITEEHLESQYNNMLIPERDLSAYGATGVSRFNPLNQSASMGQALIELYRDGLPKLPSRIFNQVKSLRSVGSEYLNAEFGWRPLLNDIRDLYNTQMNMNNRLKQIIRDNNRPIRRQGTLLKEIDTQRQIFDNFPRCYPEFEAEGPDTAQYPYPGKASEKITTISDRIWFSGRFRYYIPDVTDDRWTRQAKLALFGLNPSPSLLYSVLPWSWLLDWFTNVGDVIDNLSKNGIADIVLDYGYVMRHYKKDVDFVTKTLPTKVDYYLNSKVKSLPLSNSSFRTTLREEQKERVVATPFGFGLQLQDLSVRQHAILTALGLSRQNFL